MNDFTQHGSLSRHIHHNNNDKPAFCHDLDCPRYTLLKSFAGYELRRYEMTQWVTARTITNNYSRQINSEIFFSLFRYISGNNTAGTKIPMTAPVLNIVTPGSTNEQSSVYEMHFMIPHNMQPFPPAPTEPTVYITTLPPMDVYVKTFSGFADMAQSEQMVTSLKHSINNASLYDNTLFMTAGYDGPYTIVNRHNEGYELRQYAGTQWVATRLINKTYTDDMRREMFQSLFRYISGNNTSGVKINMTSPVLTTIRHTGNVNHDTVVEMHFMIPFAMQPYPPRPTESHVYITFFPSVRAYVKSFPGFATQTDYLIKVIELEHEINNSTLYDGKHYHTAGYDGPVTINRHNEVWLMATMQ
ncbi:hypothetical protein FSP39_004603 [Pinctada imbricata]|uniref:Uncharacterized protein n=1 Tax=Pinctada imbricata TaxID=66713 RepID=A0AA88Y360_PINIB|nr:hypothetical protein FSP39_004603 [Pinctada imbricata]